MRAFLYGNQYFGHALEGLCNGGNALRVWFGNVGKFAWVLRFATVYRRYENARKGRYLYQKMRAER